MTAVIITLTKQQKMSPFSYLFFFQISDGRSIHHLSVRYFDHLLQSNMLAMVTCENTAISQLLTPTSGTCTSKDITMRLPPRTRLQSVKAFSHKPVAVTTLTKTIPHGEIIQIPRLSDMVSSFKDKSRATDLC